MNKSNEEIERILDHLGTIENFLHYLVLPKKDKILENAMKVFGTSKKRAEVYLVLDGTKSATSIANELDMKRPNVSIEIGILLENGIIEPHTKEGGGYIYRKNRALEMLGLSEVVRNSLKPSEKT